MSREAGNISYFDFLNSSKPEHERIVSHLNEIPEFQRNYVWKPAQVKELILSVKENEEKYYIGNIVIVSRAVGRSSIVDGQQRLVTLSMLAKLLSDEVSSPETRDKLVKLYFTHDGHNKLNFTREKLQTTYTAILNGQDINPDNLDASQKRLYVVFTALKSEIRECDKEELAKKLCLLELIVIISTSEEDAYQLFEGLNSTGLSLSSVELTKNALLGKVKALSPTDVEIAIEIWNKMEVGFENSKSADWFNKFLRHTWFSKEGYVSNAGLYKAVKESIIKGEVDVEKIIEFLITLNKQSKIYLNYKTATLAKSNVNNKMSEMSWKKLSSAIANIERLGVDQVYSVILALHTYGEINPSYTERDRYAEHISKLFYFSVVVKYSKLSPATYERKFASLCKDIHGKSYSEFKNVTNQFFADLGSLIRSQSEAFINNLTQNVDVSSTSREFVRTIMDDYLRYVGKGADDKITIEHIVPESDLSEWIHIEDSDMTLGYVNKIGNITLLSEELNNDAGVHDFDTKNNQAYLKSRYTENNSLEVDWGSEFNSPNPAHNAIEPRGKKIAEKLFEMYLESLMKN